MVGELHTIQFCGFGGQGIILSSVILGTAAVTKAGYNAVQTQSYGSEARGGECQAELILSLNPIYSPIAEEVDILVAMSQPALHTYLRRLKRGGLLIIDPELVKQPDREDITILPVPASQRASDLGLKLAANMFMLGFIQQITGWVSESDLLEVIEGNVPERFINLNRKAAQAGMAFARETQFKLITPGSSIEFHGRG
jgi:2-oxoglutarate ferredoxin oxidoreductase subunit gamma